MTAADATAPRAIADGILVVDKPAGWTSHDVVARVRRLAGTRKVGHAGTLDPMATGVLVLGIGRGTRLLTYLVGCDKEYTATIRLGVATVTDDALGEPVATADPALLAGLDDATIRDALGGFLGRIEQVPSAVSAIKIDGQRAYARVRAGEEVAPPARQVTVTRFDVLDRRGPDLDVEVEVSSGTYVRALARDLGARLGVGGHLTALRRTRVGPFAIGQAHDLDHLARCSPVTGGVDAPGLPVLALGEAAAAAMPVHEVSEQDAPALRHGRRIPSLPSRPGAPVAALDPAGDLIAILDETTPMARPLAVFPAPAAGVS